MKTTIPTKEIEQYATFFKSIGYPIAYGKIFGYLVTSSPHLRTFEEIVNDLKLSKGSVSMTLQQMTSTGFVGYTTKIGERKRYFKISLENWSGGLEKKIRESARFTEMLQVSLSKIQKTDELHIKNIKLLIKIEKMSQELTKKLILELKKSR